MQIDRNGQTLKDFIEKNHTLLSAEAVFATITALLASLPIKWIGIALSFISVAGMVVIWHEIKAQLPIKMDPKLFIFRYVLLWGFGGLVFYWLLEFREIWHFFLFVPLAILFVYEIIQTLNPLTKFAFIKRIFGIDIKKSAFQKILKILVIILISFCSFYFAALISLPLNLIFDLIKNSFN